MNITPRSAWNPTAQLVGTMKLPARGVFVHHSVSSASASLPEAMRSIERTGKQRFGRFSYSFASHRHEGVAEGAGRSVGAHTGGRGPDGVGWNHVAFGYCLIGNYENDQLTDEQIREFGEWCQQMVREGALVSDFFISPHRDVRATACPGRNTLARWEDLVASARGRRTGSAGPANAGEVIGPGSTGQAVEDLQAILWMWTDKSVVVDGTFDDTTAEASKRHKEMLAPVVSRPHWIDPTTPLWSYRTFSMHFEFEQKVRDLAQAGDGDAPDTGVDQTEGGDSSG